MVTFMAAGPAAGPDGGPPGPAATGLRLRPEPGLRSLNGGTVLLGGYPHRLLRLGAAGAGQSSWGPAVYGLVGSEAHGHQIARRLEAELGAGGRAQVVRFDNRGARVEEVA